MANGFNLTHMLVCAVAGAAATTRHTVIDSPVRTGAADRTS